MNNAILNAFILIWLPVICFWRCSYENKKIIRGVHTNITYLDIPKSGQDTLKLSLFSDHVVYIPLETTKNSFLKNIIHIWLNDSILLLNDVHKLLMFSKNGKFIKQVGKEGKGPGEHQIIMSFDVIRDTIYLSTTGKKSLIRFTLEGNFCDELTFNHQLPYFSSTSEGNLVWYNYPEGKVYTYNKNFRIEDTIVVDYGVTEGRYRYIHLEPFMPYFQKTFSGLLFNNHISDTIWNITEMGKKPAFVLEGIEHMLLPHEKKVEFSNGNFEKWSKIYEAYYIFHLMSFPEQLFIFQKHYDAKEYSAIYLKNASTDVMKKFNSSFIYDDIAGHIRLQKFIFTSSTEYLIGIIYPYQLEDNINQYDSFEELDELKNINSNDNPIIVLSKIRKNEK